MHIGELARRTGLTVKTVRYYSDLGLVPEAERTLSGYRRYDATAQVRLEFVRTLRELGLDLATIRKVLERDRDLPSVAAAHAEALSAQIRILRLQRAALRAIAREELGPREVDRVNRIALASAEERRRIIAEFLDAIFTDVPVDPQFAAMMRRAAPELPDDPTDEQVDAWLELAELVRDEDFRQRLREMGRRSFGGGAASQPSWSATRPSRHWTPASSRTRRRPPPSSTNWSARTRPRTGVPTTTRTAASCWTPSSTAATRAPNGTGS